MWLRSRGGLVTAGVTCLLLIWDLQALVVRRCISIYMYRMMGQICKVQFSRIGGLNFTIALESSQTDII